ncbi:MAG: hypothetical protein Athens071424_3 [Parcubacteria group bacterium Athens0714_24]|nr:MAG: hypothetical protein Athens071424_3 [Parcubacteria group bacterium Athens0714_24]
MIEFDVGTGVPLYTQILSPYPSISDTDEWDGLKYADGNSDCGFSISNCGCAITSIVMVARSYRITNTQELDVNPKEINNWLNSESGGYVNGGVNWIAAAKYTGWRIKYEKSDKTTNNYVLLDEKLNNNQPVIAKANRGRGGISREHFFVIDKKLASTYSVKDPAWYNTKILNEGFNSDIQHVRNYDNGFDGLRIYKKGDGIAQKAMTLVLGSPAELLITDSFGNKLGKDQNGVEYNQISNGWYFEEGFDDPTGENPPSQHKNKIIQILEPTDGQYDIQIIGTGAGNYSLNSDIYDSDGNSHFQTITGNTQPNLITDYSLNLTNGKPGEIVIPVSIDIKPGTYPNSINLGSNGVIPVAIFGSAALDVKNINIPTIRLGSASVKLKGNGQSVFNYSDLNTDGFIDVVVKISTETFSLSSTDITTNLEGKLQNGITIRGSDSVRIVP